MQIFICVILGGLIYEVIYQGIQIRKLRRQTIQAFLKVCESVKNTKIWRKKKYRNN